MTRKQAFADFQSSTCRCGKRKKAGYSFCLSCYRKLTHEMQTDLYKHFGQGYEEAYGEAVAFLFNNEPRGRIIR